MEGKENEKILLRIVILEMMMVSQEMAKEDKVTQLKDILKNKYRWESIWGFRSFIEFLDLFEGVCMVLLKWSS